MLVLVLVAAVDANTLMTQVAERAAISARTVHDAGITGTKTEEEHDVDGARERLMVRKVWRLETAPDGMRQRLAELNGEPTRDSALERPKFDLTAFLATMREKYRFTMASPEPVNGSWAVAFHPKNPDAPAADSREAVINHLAGMVYVDTETLTVRRIHGWLEKGFSRHGVGRVSEASVLLEQEVIHDLPLPQKSVFQVRYSKTLGIFNATTRVTVTYAYDPLPEPVIAATPSP